MLINDITRYPRKLPSIEEQYAVKALLDENEDLANHVFKEKKVILSSDDLDMLIKTLIETKKPDDIQRILSKVGKFIWQFNAADSAITLIKRLVCQVQQKTESNQIVHKENIIATFEILFGLIESEIPRDLHDQLIFMEALEVDQLCYLSFHYNDVRFVDFFLKRISPALWDALYLRVDELIQISALSLCRFTARVYFKKEATIKQLKSRFPMCYQEENRYSLIQLAIKDECLPMAISLIQAGVSLEPVELELLYYLAFKAGNGDDLKLATTLFTALYAREFPCSDKIWLMASHRLHSCDTPEARGSRFLISLIKLGVVIPTEKVSLLYLLMDAVNSSDFEGMAAIIHQGSFSKFVLFNLLIDIAIRENNTDFLEELLSQPNDSLEALKNTPLTFACHNDRVINFVVARIFVNKGFQIDRQTQIALAWTAAEAGDWLLVEQMNDRLQPGELLRYCKTNALGQSLADYADLWGQKALSTALRVKDYRAFKPVFFSVGKEQFPRHQLMQAVEGDSIRKRVDEAKPNKTTVKQRTTDSNNPGLLSTYRPY